MPVPRQGCVRSCNHVYARGIDFVSFYGFSNRISNCPNSDIFRFSFCYVKLYLKENECYQKNTMQCVFVFQNLFLDNTTRQIKFIQTILMYIIIKDFTMTVKCRIAIKTLFFYFNLSSSVKLNSFSYSLKNIHSYYIYYRSIILESI